MPHDPALYPWIERVATRMPTLSRPPAPVLALYSYGLVLAQPCGLTRVAVTLAALLGRSAHSVRQRLRDFYLPAARKRGPARAELDPAACFGPLLRWVVGGWADRRVALALDVTNLADRFHVLCAAVVYRGGAIPVAWHVARGNRPGGWNRHWKRLLRLLRAELGPGWQVLVLTDRGLESAALFGAICRLGWHPLMRVKGHGTFRPAGCRRARPMGQLVRRGGFWSGEGVAYRRQRLPCTLPACWQERHAGPWLILTDLAAPRGQAGWYGLRGGVEPLFKAVKRGGWQWQQARMTDPRRVERHWVVLAVATVWAMEVGGSAESGPLPAAPCPRGRRWCRVFRLGLALILVGLLGGQVAAGQFLPQPWPEPEGGHPTTTTNTMNHENTYP